MRLLILIYISLTFTATAAAEYRAYELLLTNAETKVEKIFITTMDHYQYAQYYHLNPNEYLSYVSSWMCWENTSHRKICDRPAPAVNTTDQTREPAEITQ